MHYKELAQEILKEFNTISSEFSSFQNKSKLSCIEGCGKCCFKTDVYCSPVELLPMALNLLEKGVAQSYYDKCSVENDLDQCIFLEVKDQSKFQGQCSHYEFRPLVCRTFGVSARHGKNARVDFSVCTPLKSEKKVEYEELIGNESLKNENIPFIDHCKNNLINLDPAFLQNEMPMKEALKEMLSKVLFYSQYEN